MSKDGSGRLAPPPGMRGMYGPPPGYDHPDVRRFEAQLAAEKYYAARMQQRGPGGPPPFPPGFPGPPPDFSMAMMVPPPGMMLPPGMPPPGFPFPPFPPGAFPPGYFGPGGGPPPGMGPHGSPQRSPVARQSGRGTPPQLQYFPDGLPHRATSDRSLTGRKDLPSPRNASGLENGSGRNSYPGSPPRRSTSPNRRPESPGRGPPPGHYPDANRPGKAFHPGGSAEHAAPPQLGYKHERDHDVSPHELGPRGGEHEPRSSYGAHADDRFDHDIRDPERSLDDREAKRLRRKQSNRESARRSRLRKQAECEELTGRIEHLHKVNQQLQMDLMALCNTRDDLIMRQHMIENELHRIAEVEAAV